MKDLRVLLIELNEVNSAIDKIQNDPAYIDQRAHEIFKDKPRKDHRADIEKIAALL
jgi:hypothetical protein